MKHYQEKVYFELYQSLVLLENWRNCKFWIIFRSARNLKSFLVRLKVYPLDGKVGSEKM